MNIELTTFGSSAERPLNTQSESKGVLAFVLRILQAIGSALRFVKEWAKSQFNTKKVEPVQVQLQSVQAQVEPAEKVVALGPNTVVRASVFEELGFRFIRQPSGD